MDPYENIGALPPDILADLPTLIVDRQGRDPAAHMKTEGVIGHAEPGVTYRLGPDGLTRAQDAAGPAPLRHVAVPAPPHVQVQGQWQIDEDTDAGDANILGGFGRLMLTGERLLIPEAPATSEALAYYGARLIAIGDTMAFETDANLPVTVVRVGATYVEQYLKVAALGGGAFIEYHDRPHLHMPLEPTAGGYLLFGRADGDDYQFSAFRIPFGQAIYTPPYALHADPYLVGRYLVVYSVTKRYSTVVFRAPDGGLADVRVTPAGYGVLTRRPVGPQSG